MFFGWALDELTLFFSLFIFWLLIDVCHTVFITVKYVFFVFLGMLDKGLRIFFFVSCSRQDAKEKNLLFLCQAQKFQSFLFKFYNIRSENLVLNQLTISLLMFFFIPITCLLDIVRNFYNSNIFFLSCGECGTRKHFFLTRTQDFFFVPCLRQDGKEKNLLFLYQAKKLQSFLSKFCNICMENLVSDQLTITL